MLNLRLQLLAKCIGFLATFQCPHICGSKDRVALSEIAGSGQAASTITFWPVWGVFGWHTESLLCVIHDKILQLSASPISRWMWKQQKNKASHQRQDWSWHRNEKKLLLVQTLFVQGEKKELHPLETKQANKQIIKQNLKKQKVQIQFESILGNSGQRMIQFSYWWMQEWAGLYLKISVKISNAELFLNSWKQPLLQWAL